MSFKVKKLNVIIRYTWVMGKVFNGVTLVVNFELLRLQNVLLSFPRKEF